MARDVTAFLTAHADDYDLVLASRDWHDADNDNGGHFAAIGDSPNFVTTWPVHCVADTPGAAYHPELSLPSDTVHVKKGQGVPAYSMFEGHTDDGRTVGEVLQDAGVTEVDVVGIATDHCVRASALDARQSGCAVRVLDTLVAAVSPETEETARQEMAEAGVVFAQD